MNLILLLLVSLYYYSTYNTLGNCLEDEIDSFSGYQENVCASMLNGARSVIYNMPDISFYFGTGCTDYLYTSILFMDACRRPTFPNVFSGSKNSLNNVTETTLDSKTISVQDSFIVNNQLSFLSLRDIIRSMTPPTIESYLEDHSRKRRTREELAVQTAQQIDPLTAPELEGLDTGLYYQSYATDDQSNAKSTDDIFDDDWKFDGVNDDNPLTGRAKPKQTFSKWHKITIPITVTPTIAPTLRLGKFSSLLFVFLAHFDVFSGKTSFPTQSPTKVPTFSPTKQVKCGIIVTQVR